MVDITKHRMLVEWWPAEPRKTPRQSDVYPNSVTYIPKNYICYTISSMSYCYIEIHMSNERAGILQTVCHVAGSGAVQFRVKGRTLETGWVRVGDPTSDFGVAMLIALEARGSFSRIKIEGDDGSIRGTVGRKRAEFTELGVIRWPAFPLLAAGLRMLVGNQKSDELTVSESLKGRRTTLGGENAC